MSGGMDNIGTREMNEKISIPKLVESVILRNQLNYRGHSNGVFSEINGVYGSTTIHSDFLGDNLKERDNITWKDYVKMLEVLHDFGYIKLIDGDSYKDEVSKLRNRLTISERMNNSSELQNSGNKQIPMLTSLVKNMKEKIDGLRAELKKKDEVLAGSQERMKLFGMFRDKMDQVKLEKEGLQENVDALNTRITTQSEENTKSEEKIQQMKVVIVKQEKAINDFSESMKEKEEEYRSIQSKLEEANRHLQNEKQMMMLEKKNSERWMTQSTHESERRTKLDQEKFILKNKIDDMERTITESKHEMEKTMVRVAEEQKKKESVIRSRLNKEKEDTRTSLEKKIEEIQHIHKSEIISLTSRLTKAETFLRRVTEENSNVKSENLTLRNQVKHQNEKCHKDLQLQRTQHQEEKEKLRTDYDEKLQKVQVGLFAELQNVREESKKLSNDGINQIRREHEGIIQQLNTGHRNEIRQKKKEIELIKKSNADVVLGLKREISELRNEKKKNTKTQKEEILRLKSKHQNETEKHLNDHLVVITELKEGKKKSEETTKYFQDALTKIQKEKDTIAVQFDLKLSEIKEKTDERIRKLVSKYEERIRLKNEQIKRVEQERKDIAKEHSEIMILEKNKYEEEIQRTRSYCEERIRKCDEAMGDLKLVSAENNELNSQLGEVKGKYQVLRKRHEDTMRRHEDAKKRFEDETVKVREMDSRLQKIREARELEKKQNRMREDKMRTEMTEEFSKQLEDKDRVIEKLKKKKKEVTVRLDLIQTKTKEFLEDMKEVKKENENLKRKTAIMESKYSNKIINSEIDLKLTKTFCAMNQIADEYQKMGITKYVPPELVCVSTIVNPPITKENEVEIGSEVSFCFNLGHRNKEERPDLIKEGYKHDLQKLGYSVTINGHLLPKKEIKIGSKSIKFDVKFVQRIAYQIQVRVGDQINTSINIRATETKIDPKSSWIMMRKESGSGVGTARIFRSDGRTERAGQSWDGPEKVQVRSGGFIYKGENLFVGAILKNEKGVIVRKKELEVIVTSRRLTKPYRYRFNPTEWNDGIKGFEMEKGISLPVGLFSIQVVVSNVSLSCQVNVIEPKRVVIRLDGDLSTVQNFPSILSNRLSEQRILCDIYEPSARLPQGVRPDLQLHLKGGSQTPLTDDDGLRENMDNLIECSSTKSAIYIHLKPRMSADSYWKSFGKIRNQKKNADFPSMLFSGGFIPKEVRDDVFMPFDNGELVKDVECYEDQMGQLIVLVEKVFNEVKKRKN